MSPRAEHEGDTSEGNAVIRAIVWKELREQGVIGLTLMVLGSGILVAAATLADPPTQGASPADIIRFLGAGMLATLLLAVTAGTVCGGALFAAERESGTMGFLESLPASRWQLWRAKIAAGTILVAVEVAFVLAVAAGLGVVETLNWAIAIAIYSLLAFVWGLFGSTHSQTTLGSVGVAVPSGAFAAVCFYLPIGLYYHNPRTNMLQGVGGPLFLGLMFATPLLGSAFRFTRRDRERAVDDPTPARRADGKPTAPRVQKSVAGRSRIGVRALLWLAVRQLLKPGCAIGAFMLFLGCSLLVDTIQPVLVWPALALTAGVLAGVTAFVDEQSNGIARFWGEGRLPIGRLWVVKIAVHAAFALLLAALVILPAALQAGVAGTPLIRGGSFLSNTFRTLLFDGSHLGSQGWKFVLLPLAYGFAAGHLCGLLFRKAVVAAGVAGLVGGTIAAFWFPSLLSGGVAHWQIWIPPALALLTARLLFRAWASDRLTARQPLLLLSGGLAALLLILAAGLGFRAVEVLDDPTSEDDLHYVAGLPPLEANDSGRMFRTAAERFARVALTVPHSQKQPERTGSTIVRGSIDERIANGPYQGLNANDAELNDWLAKVYELDSAPGDQEESWFVQADKAGRERLVGIFEHPLRTGSSSSLITQANGRRMGSVLLMHGLQKQAAGDPASFPADLRTALALGQAFRNGSMVAALGFGNDIARAAFSATDRWLAALDGCPDLLRAALRCLQNDDPSMPFDPRPHLLAERYVMRDQAKAPAQFLPAQLTPPGKNPESVSALVDVIAVAWNVPWERERTRRLLGVGFESGGADRADRSLVRGRPGANLFLLRKQTPEELIENDRQIRLHRRAAILALAIRLHHAEKQSVPNALTDLVAAGYLPKVPLDPYDDLPLRYRISPGEVLPAPSMPRLGTLPETPTVPVMKTSLNQEPRAVAKGQPLLWSSGVDRTDDGGRNAPTRPGTSRSGADIVFLVPLPPAKP